MPSEKVTVPVDKAVPFALTIAVSSVDAVDAMAGGSAATDVVVATGAAVTVTETDPFELEKVPIAT